MKKSVLGVVTLCAAVGFVGCGYDAAYHGGGGSYAQPSQPGTGSGYQGHGYSDAGVAPGGGGAAFGDAAALPPMESDVSEPDPRAEPEIVVSPFVTTADDPFSTFAADVDTASYDSFERDVTNRTLPPAWAIRLEEFVNYFDYAYEMPEADAEVPFTIDLAAARNPVNGELTQVRVGIQAEAAPPRESAPANIVFLVDVSGSMGGRGKLDLVQRVIRGSLDQLSENDRVSIVTYAGSTRVALPPTPATETGRIRAVVNRLRSGGGTAGGEGIQLAYAQARAGFIEGGINHVVLCTDGDFNIGISNTEELVELIEYERRSGVTLTALGFGSYIHNDAMMERVSNAGNGIYSVIISQDHADRYAAEDLLNTVTHVAQNMKIQVEFNPTLVRAYRLLGYENRAVADVDFREDSVDAGEVGAEHRVTALYEIVLTDEEIPTPEGAPEVSVGEESDTLREIDPGNLVEVRVRWQEPGARLDATADEIQATITPADIATDSVDQDFAWASAVAEFAQILADNPYSSEADLDAIERIVRMQSERDGDRARFAELFEDARDLLGR